jgi:hypothetical protein
MLSNVHVFKKLKEESTSFCCFVDIEGPIKIDVLGVLGQK